MLLPVLAIVLVGVLGLASVGVTAVQAQGLAAAMARSAAVGGDAEVHALAAGRDLQVAIDPPGHLREVGDLVTVRLTLPVAVPLLQAELDVTVGAATVVEEVP